MAKDAKSNKDEKNKKHFFKDFKAELKKVIWPTPKQIVNNTIAVITIVLITAVIVFVLDLIFDIFNEQGINRLKANIKNKVVVENVTDQNSENTENVTEEVTTENTNSENESIDNTVENETSSNNEQ